MPNHVLNELVFERPQSEHAGILASACNSEGSVDFGVLVPMPLNVWRGDVGRAHSEAFGANCTGLDWARAQWGTKWNAYGMQPTISNEGELILRFETAWSPPYPWLVALFNVHGDFQHNWLDEGAPRGRAGRFETAQRGPQWSEAEADDALHRHLHKLHWGVEEFEDDAS